MNSNELFKPEPQDTLGVPRDRMPQIHKDDYEDFLLYLKDKGGRFIKRVVPADELKATQKEFSDKGIMKAFGKDEDKPILASSDNYIIDGHHRWLAAINQESNVTIYQFDLPISVMMDYARKFPNATYKPIYEDQLDELDLTKGLRGLKATLMAPHQKEKIRKAYKFLQKRGVNNPVHELSKMFVDIDSRDIQRIVGEQHELDESAGRITKQNQTVDVGPNEITIQAKKLGFTVTKDGYPPLLESAQKVESPYVGEFLVYHKPSAKQLLTLLKRSKDQELRFLTTIDGHWYFWDAYYGIHNEVLRYLGHNRSDMYDYGYVSKGSSGTIFLDTDQVKFPRELIDRYIRSIATFEEIDSGWVYAKIKGQEVNEQLDVKTLSPQDIAKKYGVSIDQIFKQLAIGVEEEQEHTTDHKVALEIALDHLLEDPEYYTKLQQMSEPDVPEIKESKVLDKLDLSYYGSLVNPDGDVIPVFTFSHAATLGEFLYENPGYDPELEQILNQYGGGEYFKSEAADRGWLRIVHDNPYEDGISIEGHTDIVQDFIAANMSIFDSIPKLLVDGTKNAVVRFNMESDAGKRAFKMWVRKKIPTEPKTYKVFESVGAALGTGYGGWFDPDGKFHEVPEASHAMWFLDNIIPEHKDSKKHEDSLRASYDAYIYDTAFKMGWVRIVTEESYALNGMIDDVRKILRKRVKDALAVGRVDIDTPTGYASFDLHKPRERRELNTFIRTGDINLTGIYEHQILGNIKEKWDQLNEIEPIQLSKTVIPSELNAKRNSFLRSSFISKMDGGKLNGKYPIELGYSSMSEDYQIFVLTPDQKDVMAYIRGDLIGPKTIITGMTLVSNKFQGKGLGFSLYKHLILNLGFRLQSDDKQSSGAQKLWLRLAKDPKIQVYAYDPFERNTKKRYLPVFLDDDNQLSIPHKDLYTPELEELSLEFRRLYNIRKRLVDAHEKERSEDKKEKLWYSIEDIDEKISDIEDKVNDIRRSDPSQNIVLIAIKKENKNERTSESSKVVKSSRTSRLSNTMAAESSPRKKRQTKT